MTYIVTGISGGLGKAIAEKLLLEGNKVIGISRKCAIQNPNFHFIKCDLSDPDQISSLQLELDDDKITLINNAGIIGDIKRISEQKNSDLSLVLQINAIAPLELLKKVYDTLSDDQKDNFTLVNISSGAANRSIPSWSSYCASKAALNMLSENFHKEERELGRRPKVYAVAPGVIDTPMQEQIRSSREEDFSAHGKFVELKTNGDLYSPEEAAERLIQLLKMSYKESVFYDLRDL